MNITVHGVIINDSNEILCVSRKDNHLDFGLPAGKVDPCDLNTEDALVREVKEETGLDINKSSLVNVFSMFANGNMGYTYLIKEWEGEINTNEEHVVKWGTTDDITEGSFGEWNKLVIKSITNMGISIK